MQNPSESVGQAIARAMARAAELRETSARRVRVRFLTRFGDFEDGLTIHAAISPKTISEGEAQLGKGVRHVRFEDLDARAGELGQLVDEAAAEVEAAVATAPAPILRPSQREGEFATAAFEDLVRGSHMAMLDATQPLMRSASVHLSSAGLGEAIALAALQVAALSALGGRIELDELLEMLTDEVRQVRARLMERPPAEVSVH